MRAPEYLEFLCTPLFERTRKGVLTDDDVKVLEDALLENPDLGAVVRQTGGVRKARAAQEGPGKSGSARVAYLYVRVQQTIYFVCAFSKNDQENLTAGQKQLIRRLVWEIEKEEWPRKRPVS
ncbi:MAG TPA: type II toxin-antitoxin system RelE/ParE family toxin [Longimicrobium sp.]|nr:type II toxin-antitoxin system RelE/ParE family toxin [Longimicrobium sp.]